MSERPDKWTPFLLSLAVPGVGQLWAGSFTCLAWFVAAGLVASFWLSLAEGGDHRLLMIGQFVSLAALAVCSAEHAKRLVEPVATPRRGKLAWRVSTIRRSGRAISMRSEIDVPLSPSELWRRISDLPAFLTIDPFHDKVVLTRREPATGIHLVLWHNAFGRRFPRFGRILAWRVGRGYSFSDLSARGPGHGFPHVFCVEIKPAPVNDARCSRLIIAVRGKWTSRWIPTAVGRVWIGLVCREHARLLAKGL